MVSFHHAYKAYANGVVAIRDLTFELEKGEMVFLTGPSGAGKTTLFKLLSAYDVATSGRVRVAGLDLNERLTPSRVAFFRRQIGVVYQNFMLLLDRTVLENVILPLEIRGDSKARVHTRALDLLESLGMRAHADRFPFELSGGEQQRVAIARALIHRPGILIADEPTGNLDAERSDEIMDLFERANAQGTTVIVATHDTKMVSRRCHRVLRLVGGQLIGSA